MADIRDELILHQRENEQHFLASAFSAPELVIEECGWLRSDMLVDGEVAAFWGTLLETRDPMRAANTTGLLAKITLAAANTPNVMFYQEYARAIAEDHFLLKVIETMGAIATNASAHNVPQIFAAIESLRSMSVPGYKSGITAVDAGGQFNSMIDRVAEGEKLAVISHIGTLDEEIGGFFRGELTVIAARPSTGKTALILQIARNIALGGVALLFSLEMSASQLWARVACSYAGYSWADVRVGKVGREGLSKIKIASEELRYKYGKNLIIVDSAYTVSEMHQISAQYRPDLVLIDQLGDIVWHDPRESPVIWYGKAIEYIRHYIAKGLDVPIIINHHLNRSLEAREDKRPTLADLRWSGDIEQKGDVILLLYRRDQHEGRGVEQYDVPVEVKVAKNRQGDAGGVAVLNYNLEQQWFT